MPTSSIAPSGRSNREAPAIGSCPAELVDGELWSHTPGTERVTGPVITGGWSGPLGSSSSGAGGSVLPPGGGPTPRSPNVRDNEVWEQDRPKNKNKTQGTRQEEQFKQAKERETGGEDEVKNDEQDDDGQGLARSRSNSGETSMVA